MPHLCPSSIPANFDIPLRNSGRGLTFTAGPGVGIYVDFQPPYTWPVHHHPVVQIVLALEKVEVDLAWEDPAGRHELTYNGSHVWLLPPGAPHEATWKGTAAMVVLYIEPEHIHAEFGRAVTHGALLPLTYFTQRDYMVVGLCRKLRDLCHDRRPFSPTFVAASGGLLAPLILQTYLQPNDLKSRKIPVLPEDRLRRVSEYIDTHLRDHVTRSDLARVAGLAEHHFSRLFKNSAGLPPMKYVWRCRLYEARRLLESGAWKVAAAAAETGFCDQSHLDRQFRREFNCSPGSVIPGGPANPASSFPVAPPGPATPVDLPSVPRRAATAYSKSGYEDPVPRNLPSAGTGPPVPPVRSSTDPAAPVLPGVPPQRGLK